MKKLLYILVTFFLFSSCSKEKKTDKAAEKMQDFVINISNYARGYDSDFIIIPQNGVELAFNNTDPDDGLNTSYMNAVNGFGVEELFYDGELLAEDERLSMLRQLKTSKKIMVSDYLSDVNYMPDDKNRNYKEGFICFPRINPYYNYEVVPDSTYNANTDSILSLDDAQNYLYLISTDNYASKEDMIHAISERYYDVILIDLFFNEVALTSSEISQLKMKPNGVPRLVIAYMNIGSAEKFRYYWGKSWGLYHPLWLKKKYKGYDDEFWVKFWKDDWKDIIYGNDGSYTKKILDAGFDGAYLDNVEAYYFLYND